MSTWAVVASGESATPEAVESVRDLPCVAVNNAYLLAPWARALVANDAGWWRQYPEAMAFPGDKWCGSQIRDRLYMPRQRGLGPGTNSGLRALDQAIHRYQATRVLLIGVDMVGRHFHADHPAPLGNPTDARFVLFRQQWQKYAKEQLPSHVEVLNCSPISMLECFRKVSIAEAMCLTS